MQHFKRSLLALSYLLISSLSFAQIIQPVDWSYDIESVGNNEYDIIFKATIEHPWHMYGVYIDEGGPIPTGFNFEDNSAVDLVGKIKEPKGIETHDEMFMMDLKYFEHDAEFRQRVKSTGAGTNLTGELEYMVCNDQQCLAPEYEEFSFEIPASVAKSSATAAADEEPEASDDNADASEEDESEDQEEPEEESGILTPVTWTAELFAIEGEEDMYQIRATATIDEGWHLYSLNLPADDGPVATELNLLTTEGAEEVNEAFEGGDLITEHDPNFDMDLSFFSNEATMALDIKVSDASLESILAEVYFMTCNDKKCLLPEAIEFNFALADAKTLSADEKGLVLNKVEGHGEENGDHEEAAEGAKKDSEDSRSLVSIFLLSFLGGLAALLTPCVFPMIPMTVSFFTKQSKTRAAGIRNAFTYGFSIIAIYTILGFIVTKSFGPDALNALSTDPIFNIFFFLLLVVFAISFLGAFEITLPSSWVNKADTASDKGGLIGIFFMAATLSLVSFSCTGPIIGTLLVEAAVHGGNSGPLIGMFGFSLALALPFGLFAAFPGWMNSLPKSGGWLNTVKVVLGWLELALAFKFLSTADMVMQWHILPREIFLAIWIGIFFMLFLYLIGAYQLPHDSKMEKLSVGRAVFGSFVLIFVIYLLPGMWGAPVKLIAGFPPAKFYSESPKGVGFEGGGSSMVAAADIPEGADPEHCPHGLNCFHDYETGLAYAKEVGKPVLLDFTGWGCVNCRKMEEEVWSDPKVLKRLQEEFVLISLYVDEREKLPEDEQYVSETTGKKVKTVGNKWSDFQAKHYNANSQPYYVILDHEEKQLNESTSYDPDIEFYVDWLDRGKSEFEKTK